MTLQSRLMNVTIEDEMKQSFMDYAMSVIISRALPDARDGLKPVHRRILYTMHRLRNFWNQPHVKSARVVGDTMGKLHPHGDASIYDALVRMAQPFSMRVMLADGQGNFGSVDGDPAAAMRYTEVRMAKVAGELLADIEKETVDFVPNYDEKDEEPTVLPTRFPNLLVNGSAGIAVGMATNIAPHNLGEIIRATIALIQNPELTTPQLMEYVPAPDFPTGGIIYGRGGVYSAYNTGRGSVVVRARTEIEELDNGKSQIVVTEIPYQVNKTRLLEKIADLAKEKRIEHISDVRDESDRHGMRIVIVLKRDAPAEIVLNKLYKLSPLQNSFGVNMVAIVDRRPKLLTLKAALGVFIRHRRQVVVRRSQFELRQALDRKELVEGLGLASVDIETVIQIIRQSRDPDEARQRLMAHEFSGLKAFLVRAGRPAEEIEAALAQGPYHLSERQAQAILDMRLQRLTGLQQEKLAGEYAELCATIESLRRVLGDDERLKKVIIEELEEVADKYGDPRRTEIVEESGDITVEDLIADEPMVVTMTISGYVKRTPLVEFKAQQRGGKGRRGARVRSEDELATTFVASSLSNVLLFTDKGRAFSVKVYQIPKGAPHARGKPFVNVVDLQAEEKVMQMLPVNEFEPDKYIVMATSRGKIKKTDLMAFANIRANGIIAIVLEEDDALIEAKLTDGTMEIMLATAMGQAIRFSEEQVRAMGRVSRGVRGIKLRPGDSVVSMSPVETDSEWMGLTVTEQGYGKLTPLSEYPTRNRAGMGVLTARLRKRDGQVVCFRIVNSSDDVMLVTSRGTVIRTPVEGISVRGRVTTGVTLVRVADEEVVTAVVRLPEEEEPEDEELEEQELENGGAAIGAETEGEALHTEKQQGAVTVHPPGQPPVQSAEQQEKRPPDAQKKGVKDFDEVQNTQSESSGKNTDDEA